MNQTSSDPSQWPIDRKIQTHKGSGWDRWDEFVDDTPELGVALLDALPHDTRQETDMTILAIWYWLKAGGSNNPQIGRHDDGALDICWYRLGKPSQMLTGGDETTWKEIDRDDAVALQLPHEELTTTFQWKLALDPEQLDALSEPARKLAENFAAIMEAEQQWMATSLDAPVAKAFFQGQEESDRGDICDMDGCAYHWEASMDVFKAPVGDRNAMMELDQYTSDVLRESEHADVSARGWDGPYRVEARIYPPSAELRAWREACQLEDRTVGVSENHRRHRL